MNVTVNPLAQFAEVVRGVTFAKKDISLEPKPDMLPVLRAGNIQESLILDDGLVFVEQRKIRKAQLLRTNDIVMCTSSGSINVLGKTALVKESWKGSFGAFCAVIRANEEKCVPSYLYHYLNTPQFLRWVRKSDGINIKNIRKSDLDSQLVPLPPLEEQKRIVAILDKADGIRRKRQQAMAMADEFLRSVFLDMFGDPVTNPKGWEVKKLGELFVKPPRLGTITPASDSGSIPVVRVGEIGAFEINTLACRLVSLSRKERDRFLALPGDFLFARAIGSEEHLGKASVVRESDGEIVFDSHVMRLRFDKQIISPTFFWNWMKTKGGRALFMKKAGRTAVQFNINAKQVADIDIPLPDKHFQDIFSAVANKLSIIKNDSFHGDIASSLLKSITSQQLVFGSQ